MKIKHSKYRNTGLLFELLVKQIAADTISSASSPAIKILKKYFSGNTQLAKEYKLYEYILKNKNVSESKAETILSTITEISRRLNYKKLREEKYNLVSELKENYNLDNFFSIKVRDYKTLAALYCLLEAQNNDKLVDMQVFVDNKTTLLEYLTTSTPNKEDVKDSLIEEFSKYDKDLKLLTYKILLEKFNKKYNNFLPEQKEILREFIVSVSSSKKLRSFVNEKLLEVQKRLEALVDKLDDEILNIKLKEIVKNITPLTVTEEVDDSLLSILMQYYELVKELEAL